MMAVNSSDVPVAFLSPDDFVRLKNGREPDHVSENHGDETPLQAISQVIQQICVESGASTSRCYRRQLTSRLADPQLSETDLVPRNW
jgi:hypothetical protein